MLCYGDSNTYGCIGRWSDSEPTGGRYDADHRWPAVMGKTLGEGYHVIEGGFNGRSTIYDDPSAYGRNGETTLVRSLAENAPLDLVCILLGTKCPRAFCGSSASSGSIRSTAGRGSVRKFC